MDNETYNLTTAVDGFIKKNQAAFDTYAATNYPKLVEIGATTVLKAETARKYVKVWCYKRGVKESIHAFIDIQTGDIFMPAGLNAPAKHARGNVFAADNGASAFTANGYIRYLK